MEELLAWPEFKYFVINASFSSHNSRSHSSNVVLSAGGMSTSATCFVNKPLPFEAVVAWVTDKLPKGTSVATLNSLRCMWITGGAMPSKKIDRRV